MKKIIISLSLIFSTFLSNVYNVKADNGTESIYYTTIEPITENVSLFTRSGINYYRTNEYNSYNFYLPDGTLGTLRYMRNHLNNELKGFDKIIISFYNLSPNSLISFRLYGQTGTTYITGPSLIVYDVINSTTKIYDYMGNILYNNETITEFQEVQFLIPIDEVRTIKSVYLTVVPILDNGSITSYNGKNYYITNGIDSYNFYLPDGTLGDFKYMARNHATRELKDYEYIILTFYNLTPNSIFRFRLYGQSGSSNITGPSYIIFDNLLKTTTIYDYLGQPLYTRNSIAEFNEVRFLIPIEELTGTYDDGFEDGYNDGYDTGYNDGIKTITNKPTFMILQWTVPFVTLIILLGMFIGYKRMWNKK